jgi:hypothetical protein
MRILTHIDEIVNKIDETHIFFDKNLILFDKIFRPSYICTTLFTNYYIMSDNNYQEALKRIISAKERKSKKLDLSKLKLERVPGAIMELQDVEELNISYNSLENFPVEIYTLRNLKRLNISYNKLRGNFDLTRLNKLQDLTLANQVC